MSAVGARCQYFVFDEADGELFDDIIGVLFAKRHHCVALSTTMLIGVIIRDEARARCPSEILNCI